MQLDGEAVAALAAAVVLAAGSSALALAALLGQRRTRRAYRAFSAGRREDVLMLLQRHIDEVGRVRGELADARRERAELRALLARGLSRVATVRYDAFGDMGGRLSFSAAMLDEHGDGLVLTSINGRTESRAYAKPVVGGGGTEQLSEEEERAVDQAMADAGRPVPTAGHGRRPGRRASPARARALPPTAAGPVVRARPGRAPADAS